MQANNEIGMMVVSSARKLLFKVTEGPTVSFPEGAAISKYGANNAVPVVVVHNATDQSQGPEGTWQGAAAGDFVIVNEVPEDVALVALFDIYDGTNQSIVDALNYLIDNGYADQYTTGRKFWETKLSPAGRMKGESGIMKRDDRDLTRLYRDKDGVLRIFPNGQMRHIEDDILVRTYRMPNGSKIDLKSIPSEKRPSFFARLFGTRAA